MLAINHALTGALIGLTVENPVLAVPLAFASHFVCDAIPHFDPPGNQVTRIARKAFRYQLMADATLCFILVVCLALTHPKHWITAALSAFAATSPDLFWIPKYITVLKSNKWLPNKNVFWRFHAWVQWRTGPRLAVVEGIWFIAACTILTHFYLRP